MREFTVDVDGVAIHVEDEGDGRPTVLLHGFTGAGSTMADLGSRLGPVRQIRPDLVGHGSSSAPDDVEAYSMPATAAHVAAVIEHLDVGVVDVVGYSFGGRVALSLLCARPDLVAKVAVIGASPGLPTARGRFDRMTSDRQLAEAIRADGLEAFVDRWMALPMWESLAAAVGDEAWAASREQRLRGTGIGYANSLLGAGTGSMPPLHAQLETIDHPVCLVVGRNDTKFVRSSREVDDLMPNSRLWTIKDAGHAAHLERPEETARIIRDFLQ